jgi:hypothetical protein
VAGQGLPPCFWPPLSAQGTSASPRLGLGCQCHLLQRVETEISGWTSLKSVHTVGTERSVCNSVWREGSRRGAWCWSLLRGVHGCGPFLLQGSWDVRFRKSLFIVRVALTLASGCRAISAAVHCWPHPASALQVPRVVSLGTKWTVW